MKSLNSFHCARMLQCDDSTYLYFDLRLLESQFPSVSRLPHTLKILLENALRHENGTTITREHIIHLTQWTEQKNTIAQKEIAFSPARVLMQDFTGVPAIVDLAAMRQAVLDQGGDPSRVNPFCPVDLVIDHSVQVDYFSSSDAYSKNVALEMKRNEERYRFLKWGQNTFNHLRVVPPGTGICHQVNLEYLAQVVMTASSDDNALIFPDTVVGTDSHTTMINGLGVLGWGVGGIEAEAAMLGQPFFMHIPDVIGFYLSETLATGVTATDLVLTITHILRQKGVVGKFVEFYGPGVSHLSVADRATIANMAPEYGATCGFFPIDEMTIHYLKLTGRSAAHRKRIQDYAQAQGLWHEPNGEVPLFTDTISLDLSSITPCVAGPKRPQDRVSLSDLKTITESLRVSHVVSQPKKVKHGDVVIAAITSCTNTSNPSVMLAAGLLAKKAVECGLRTPAWVKTSLAPGSQVVTRYLEKTGLLESLKTLGFDLVGYGCTTCIGNSGPLPVAVAQDIAENNLCVSAVLSGNRNFEGRIHPQVQANWLASPPLVVALALAGTTCIDLINEPIGVNQSGQAVYLHDLWPSQTEINQLMECITHSMFLDAYDSVFEGDAAWQSISSNSHPVYEFNSESTYIQNPPYFIGVKKDAPKSIFNARILLVLGDSVTTDHISPAGAIIPSSPAGRYLEAHGVHCEDFNSYGSRRGNHEIMVRGTFANLRIRNEMLDHVEGGWTIHAPKAQPVSIFDAAMAYRTQHIPLIVVAGLEYGTGSSRDWAAKGTALLGVQAVIAESFERIHRSNLIGMGVLPLRFEQGVNRKTLGLTGFEVIDLFNIEHLKPNGSITMRIQRDNGTSETVCLTACIETQHELRYYTSGGILPYVLHQLMQ